MNSIELPEDYVQPPRLVIGQTLLRIALGAILVAHGVERLLAIEHWQDELASRFALLEPSAVAHGLLAVEIIGGVFLIFGWLTRVGAFALFCSALGSIALEFLRQGGAFDYIAFELPAVLGVGAFFFLLAGGGPASLDVVLRSRARRKAIENDSIWLKHPYVPTDDQADIEDDRSYTRDTYRVRRYADRR
jgi:putative oxidoreductase